MRRTNRLVGSSLGICLMLAAVACTTPEDSSRRQVAQPPASTAPHGTDDNSSPSTPDQIPCTPLIFEESEMPVGYRLVGEDVAIPEDRVLKVNESGETDPAAKLFAKWGLVVRDGAVVDIQVASPWEDKARIGWGPPFVPATSAQVRACASPEGQYQWLVFAGGTYVAREACLPLTIRSRGQEVQVQLGIGVPCDGTSTA